MCCFLCACAKGENTPSHSSFIIVNHSDEDKNLLQNITAGDRLQIRIFGEDALSGPYTVQEGDILHMPLIGVVDIRGLGPQQIAELIADAYRSARILKNPDVRVERAP